MELKLNCPICNTKMNKIKKNHVTIDRCPKCLGIWLDKGELDKIVEIRKERYKDQNVDWGQPNIGARPPSEEDDVCWLVGEGD